MNKFDAFISVHKLNLIYQGLNKCFIDDWENIVSLGGLTFPQTKLLTILLENGQSNMSQLSEKGFWHMSTVTELVNRMEKEGYLSKCIDQIDKRIVRVEITNKGKESLENTKMLYFNNSKIFNALINMNKEDLDKACDTLCNICKGVKGIEGHCKMEETLESFENFSYEEMIKSIGPVEF